jgi:two-component system OmpR family response regulator
MRIIVASLEPRTLESAERTLLAAGHEIVGVPNGATAFLASRTLAPDLILLDVRLHLGEGERICRHVREAIGVPIMMIASEAEASRAVECFGCGVEDYVDRPVRPSEIQVRYRAAVRRIGLRTAITRSQIVRASDLTVELDTGEVHVAGTPVPFTLLEARIIYFLVREAGRPVPADALVRLVWGDAPGDINALRTHIWQIRRKLRASSADAVDIQSVRRFGYQLTRRSAWTRSRSGESAARESS